MSMFRLANSRRTSTWLAGSTLRRVAERMATMAIEWASLGSFLERLVARSPIRDAKVAGTSRTSSPWATSCWANRYSSPPTDSMALVRFSKGSAQARTLDLPPGHVDLHARELVFALVDGHRGVRCLVRVDADHYLHDYLLVSLETTGGTPACGRLVLDPLLSHSVAKPWREALRTNANRLTPAAGTLRAIPPGTSKRYGSTAGPAPSLKQGTLGQGIHGDGRSGIQQSRPVCRVRQSPCNEPSSIPIFP